MSDKRFFDINGRATSTPNPSELAGRRIERLLDHFSISSGKSPDLLR